MILFLQKKWSYMGRGGFTLSNISVPFSLWNCKQNWRVVLNALCDTIILNNTRTIHWVNIGLGMACHPYNTKLLPEPVLTYCQLRHWEYTPVKLESTLSRKIFFSENACENSTCNFSANLFRPQNVKKYHLNQQNRAFRHSPWSESVGGSWYGDKAH